MGEATLLPVIGPQIPAQAPALNALEGLPGAVELEGAALNTCSPEGGRGPGSGRDGGGGGVRGWVWWEGGLGCS